MSRPTHGWCPACKEDSAIDAEGRCLWCEGDTLLHRPKKRGGGKPAGKWGKLTDPQLRLLNQLHHDQGLSQRELGRRIYQRVGFATAKSAAMAIGSGWKRLGLTARDRGAATAKANTDRRGEGSPGTADRAVYKVFLRERNGGYRRCAGVRQQYPRKGAPCSRYAMAGSDYCLQHDPARRDEIVQRAAEAREQIA